MPEQIKGATWQSAISPAGNHSTGDLCLQGAPNTASWSVSLMTTDFTFASNACIPAVARSSTPARGLQGHIGSQWRTPGRASTSLDTLSNISGRLTLCGGHTCVKPSQKQWNNHSLKAGDSTDCAKVTPANSRAYFLERVLRVGDRTKDMYSHAPLNISVANNVTRREPIAFFAETFTLVAGKPARGLKDCRNGWSLQLGPHSWAHGAAEGGMFSNSTPISWCLR